MPPSRGQPAAGGAGANSSGSGGCVNARELCAAACLPAPAIELIALHVARLESGGGSDALRHSLPLVSRSWRDVLALLPGRWEQVGMERLASGCGWALAAA